MPDLHLAAERLAAQLPDPDAALTGLRRLRERHPGAYAKLAQSHTALHHTLTVFAYSHFLTEEVLSSPECVLEAGALDHVRRSGDFAVTADSFARFRRQALVRVLLRDVLGLAALSETTAELSNLADAMLEAAYGAALSELRERYGMPEGGAGLAIIALGKLGGQELNYSSDVDLMFVYGANGHTDGGERISHKEFFKKLANRLTLMLSGHGGPGGCYRVDLRLRPEGRFGEVCISLDGARNYYKNRARDWELQMLIKARVAAGDVAVGRELLEFTEPLTYASTLDFRAVEQMSATRDRIDEKLAARRAATGGLDVKLARGGIRDIEFLAQCLQRLHGGRLEWIRHGGTLQSLSRLHDKNLLSPNEYWRLASAYEFLRHLEHRLQIAEDRQTHKLPPDAGALDVLARKMPAAVGASTREALLAQLNAHLEQVVSIYERIIHAQKPVYYTQPDLDAQTIEEVTPVAPVHGNLIRSLNETSPALADAIASVGLGRGLRAFEHFLERAANLPGLLELLEADPVFSRGLLDVFEHSPYFAGEFVRDPSLIEAARGMAFPDYTACVEAIEDAPALRRFYRREIVRIEMDSIARRAPIFDTLGRTSDLTDAAVAAAYRLSAGSMSSGAMMVIAMGRLGLREFDLASDADLVFVVPDSAQSEMLAWTRVAERTVELLSAYTGDGMLFSVDTRLRPNGREGALVQTVSAYKDYFSKSAEAWEGMACMKARAVVGNLEAANEFLHQLQEVDWRRYGQSGRSRTDLRAMRLRLEREQGGANALKAGRGGYYDIDFALMYLRLKGAGLFFKVLNTPERIDILEKMGHLEREDAAFFEDAATFYRALDHGLRVFSGHAEGSLPNSESKLAALDELVERWIPERMHDEPLRVKVSQIRQHTRQLFDRLFG